MFGNFRVFALALAAVASSAVAWANDSSQSPAARFYLEQARKAIENDPSLGYSPVTLLVRFEPSATNAKRDQILASVFGTRISRFTVVPGLELIGTSIGVPNALAALRRTPGVLYAEPDYVVRADVIPNDTYFGLLWGLHNTGQTIRNVAGVADADMDVPEAWDIFRGDRAFRVAVIDSGVQYTHPDLAGNMWVNPGEVPGNGVDDDGNGYVDDVYGYDFYQNDSDPMDMNGHGTHVAGTIGAVPDNGAGVAGVSWNVALVALRFLGPSGSGSTSGAIAAMQYCTLNGIKLSNNSWGGGGFSQSLYDAINAGKSVGHIFVAAAGNSGVNTDSSPSYPASYNLDNIISVAATDNRDQLASFSNYGAVTVDVGAPGVDIASTYPTNSYAWLSGTSMASPNCTGVVALVYAQNPGWTYQQVRNRIFQTVRPVAALAGRTVTGGMPNALAALVPSTNSPPTVTISSPANGSTVTVGDPVTFTGSASDVQDGDLSANIVWSSNLQGVLGTGASIVRSDLVAGTHTITAAVTDSGGLQGSASITLTVQAGSPPAAPSDVSATSLGGGSALVTWTDNSNNETGFELQREQKIGRGWANTTNLGPVGANVTNFTDNPGAGTFRYRVRALNGFGASAWSNWAQVKVR